LTLQNYFDHSVSRNHENFEGDINSFEKSKARFAKICRPYLMKNHKTSSFLVPLSFRFNDNRQFACWIFSTEHNQVLFWTLKNIISFFVIYDLLSPPCQETHRFKVTPSCSFYTSIMDKEHLNKLFT